jgi:competence protein ComEC
MPPTDIFILNVGAGSCAVISHPSGRRTMVDINNGGQIRSYEYEGLREANTGYGLSATIRKSAYETKLVDPIEWYVGVFGERDLWRFILSHPDLDHMSGIRHMFDGTITPLNFWDLPHLKRLESDSSKYPSKEALDDALRYFGFHYEIEDHGWAWTPKKVSPLRFDRADYWPQDGIEILSPSRALLDACNQAEDWNNLSYVLRVNHAGRSVLLPGDVEQKGWDDLAAACTANGVTLAADVLVASHHGRKSGYPDNGVLQQIAPQAVIVSAAQIPAKEDAVPRYRRHVPHVFSTRDEGSIGIRIWDDGQLEIYRGVDNFSNLVSLVTLSRRWAA